MSPSPEPRPDNFQSRPCSWNSAAPKYQANRPPTAKSGGGTHALPKIWDNKADFDARYGKLSQDATAAVALVKDEVSLKEQYAAVGKNCTGCHENYRAKLD